MPVFAFYVHDPGWKKGWRDKLIRVGQSIAALEWQPQSHLEYVVGGVLMAENECISASKRDGNLVRSKDIKWQEGHWVFIEIEGDDALIFQQLEDELGKRYDTFGALASVLPFGRPSDDLWFCSEIMAHVLGWDTYWKYTPGRVFKRMVAMGGKIIEAR